MPASTADPRRAVLGHAPNVSRSAEPTLRGFAWKSYAGVFAYQTVALSAGVLAAWGAGTIGVIVGVLPLWAGLAINTVAAYAAFTVMHEACHGNIHGRHGRLAWVEPTLGWLVSFTLLAPYSAFKLLHLRHHSRTNHVGEDPDLWVAGRTPVGVALRCMTIVPHYYATFLFGRLSKAHGARRVRLLGAGYLGAIAAVTIVAASTGSLAWVFGLWIGPGVLAASALAFAFDYLPHHPHNVRERLHDTRVIVAPGLWVLFLWQNYHLVHHLYPRVPFFRYAKCFEAMRPALERAGAPMWIWPEPAPRGSDPIPQIPRDARQNPAPGASLRRGRPPTHGRGMSATRQTVPRLAADAQNLPTMQVSQRSEPHRPPPAS